MRAPEESPTITEHHPSCQARCVSECGASPRRYQRPDDLPVPPRVRTLHSGPVAPAQKPAPPLWEHVTDWTAVGHHRDVGCVIVAAGAERTLLGLPIPLPESYTMHERAGERYSLDRWTRPDGIEDRALDAVHTRMAEERRSKVRATRDVEDVAMLVRGAFPAFTSGDAANPSPPVVKRAKKATARHRDLFALVIGEASPEPAKPSPWSPMYEATRHIRDVMTVHIWALALILFGRERDTLSDYALGRLLHGEPIKDVRPPFASAAHALAVASRALPGLGGGSCAWPQDDPRMRRRTWSKAGEMAIKAGFHGTDSVRGETGVHRVIDARNVERRAALEPHERAAVAVLDDRNLTRDEKATRLREVEAVRRGLDVPEESKALRDATADVSDGQLFGRAKAAQQRVRTAVDRVSKEGDALTPKREEKPKRMRVPFVPPARVLADLAEGCL